MIQSNYRSNRSPFFSLLSQDDVLEIHRAALRVLEHTGYRIMHAGVRDMFKQAGAVVREEIVKVPRFIVEQCLQTAPKGFDLYDRQGRRCMAVEGRKSYYGTSTASPTTRDAVTHKIHETRVRDMALSARVADACEHIDWVMPMGTAQDVPQTCAELYEFEAVVQNTVKPIIFCSYSPAGHKRVLEMAAEVAGGMEALRERPFVVSYPEPISPLVYPKEICEKLLACAEFGIPVIPGSAPQMGGTAPATVAGAIVLTIAEGLMGLMIAQLKRPGTPVLFGGSPTLFDMGSGYMTYGAPETQLMFAGYAEVSQYYGLPTWGLAGATDSKVLDAQAGVDVTFSLMAQTLAGLNIIHDVGYMDSGMACSAEMLVMGNEICGMIKRFMQGVEINAETLADEVIAAVGHGGNFIQEEHTFNHFKKEMWRPNLMIRQYADEWRGQGAKDMEARVQDQLKGIVEEYEPEPLSDAILDNLERLRKDGEKALAS
jgi:trimethylamine---corrinoid protein Co-methyltransferase